SAEETSITTSAALNSSTASAVDAARTDAPSGSVTVRAVRATPPTSSRSAECAMRPAIAWPVRPVMPAMAMRMGNSDTPRDPPRLHQLEQRLHPRRLRLDERQSERAYVEAQTAHGGLHGDRIRLREERGDEREVVEL